MDTIYSQRTGASAPSQAVPSNPMAVAPPRNRINMQALQDYLKQNNINPTQGQVQTPQGIDLSTLVGNAQQDMQQITRPDYDINQPQGQQPAPVDINQLIGQISGGNLAGIDIGSPQPTQGGTEAFKDEQTMADNGLLPTSAPKQISQNPTNDTKQYSQAALSNGLQSVDIGISSQNPQNAMSAESQNLDASRIKSDMASIAQAKDPKAAWQEVKQDPFYKNSNFYTGMMNTGLAIMSGANPMQAFQAGSQAMENADVKDQLKNNREYLLQQYTPDSVAAAIAAGDPKLLRQQQMSDADKMDATNAEWGRRNAITSAQEDQRFAQRLEASNRAADARSAQQEKLQNARFAQQKELLNEKDRIKQAAAKAAADDYNFTSRDLNAEKNTPEGSVIKSWSVKQGYFDAAKKDLELARDAIAKGDPQAAAAAYQQAAFNSARGEIGENRSLQEADVSGFAEDPSIFTKGTNKISLKAGWSPTLRAIDYLDKANDVGSKSADSNIQRIKIQRIKSVARTLGKERATALVNRAYGSGFHDPYGVFEEAGENEVRSRTGGALSTDDSWMYN